MLSFSGLEAKAQEVTELMAHKCEIFLLDLTR